MGRTTLKWVWQVDCPIHGPHVPAKTSASWMSSAGPIPFGDHEWPYVRDRTAINHASRERAFYAERAERRTALPDWEQVVARILEFRPAAFRLNALDSLEGQCAACGSTGPLHLVRLYPSSAQTPKECLDICFNAEGEWCNCPACLGGCHGLGRCDQVRHPRSGEEAARRLAAEPQPDPDPVDELEADLEAAAKEMSARRGNDVGRTRLEDEGEASRW